MKKRLKVSIPSLRERERYIAFEIISEGEIRYEELEKSIWNTMLTFLGEHGLSKTSIWILKKLYNEKNKVGVIKCNHKALIQVLSCLGLISRIGETRVVFKILKISGTIKGLNIK